MESAESWKLEAGSLADRVWIVLSLELQASCLKRISTLADGLMLVFKHPIRSAHRRPVQPLDEANDKKVAWKLQWISMTIGGSSPRRLASAVK
jgi:hypothetical protein